MSPDLLKRSLEVYTRALREHGVPEATLDRLLVELPIGLAFLARRGWASRAALFGDTGLDILHSVVGQILAGELAAHPADGEVLRLLNRAAWRELRSAGAIRGGGDELLLAAVAVPPAAPHDALEGYDDLIAGLDACQKRGGGVHAGRLAALHGVPVKRLRSTLRELGAELGRNDARVEFWLRRLGECLIQMLRETVERELPDLVPLRRQRTRRRLQRVLAQLQRSTIPAEAREGLKRARALVDQSAATFESIATTARLVGAPTFPIDLAAAERLRGHGRIGEALDIVTRLERTDRLDCRRGRRPSELRRPVLLRLTRARCLESRGDFAQASESLEPIASVERRDPILAYDRCVLARAAGFTQRAAAAARDLATLAARQPRCSPLLLRRVSALLAER